MIPGPFCLYTSSELAAGTVGSSGWPYGVGYSMFGGPGQGVDVLWSRSMKTTGDAGRTTTATLTSVLATYNMTPAQDRFWLDIDCRPPPVKTIYEVAVPTLLPGAPAAQPDSLVPDSGSDWGLLAHKIRGFPGDSAASGIAYNVGRMSSVLYGTENVGFLENSNPAVFPLPTGFTDEIVASHAMSDWYYENHYLIGFCHDNVVGDDIQWAGDIFVEFERLPWQEPVGSRASNLEVDL